MTCKSSWRRREREDRAVAARTARLGHPEEHVVHQDDVVDWLGGVRRSLEFPDSIVAGAVRIDLKNGAIALAPAEPGRAVERGAVQQKRAVGIYAVVGVRLAELLQDFEMRAVCVDRKKRAVAILAAESRQAEQ